MEPLFKSDKSSADGERDESGTSQVSEKIIEEQAAMDVGDISKDRPFAETRLLRKLDLRFLPMIVLIYITNFIDRMAITAARLKGLEEDLGLSDIQYETCIAILYASYCAGHIPSNMIVNRVSRPSLYIGLCVVAMGFVTAMTGLSQNFEGMFASRIFLGFPMAAFFPGAVYLLSRWYTRKELSFRTAILYSGALASNAFGSLIAAGILDNMEGKRGIRGWRWLFYIEGAMTIAVGFLSLWVLPDFPHNTRWISPPERQLASARLAEDTGEADEDLAEDSMWKGLKMAITDIKVPIFALIELGMLIAQSYANFFPTLTATLGYDTTTTLLLAAPPWIWAAIVCLLNALHADKTGERFFHVCWPWWGVIVGFIISISTMSVPGRYFSLFLLASGRAGFIVNIAWVSNTLPRPPAKRAAAIGLVNGFGNLGNFIGSYAWKVKWGPEYHESMQIGIAMLAFSSLLAFVMRCILKHKNNKLDEDKLGALKEADQRRVEDAARLEGITLEEAMERKKGYRYLY